MSLTWVKNLLFPSRATLPPSTSTTLNGETFPNEMSSGGEALQLQTRDMATANSVDLEAQRIEPRPNEEESEEPKRRFRLSPRTIGDMVLGLSDGLTVPFALTAGLSALGTTRLVILGGLAELFAGAISMGLGGYLAGKSEAASYTTTVAETRDRIRTSPGETSSLVAKVFERYHLPIETISQISKQLHEAPEELLEFLMCFHEQEAKPETSRSYAAACRIAAGYFLGGLLPLVPYFCVKKDEVMKGLWWSIGVMVIVLFAFGWGKVVADEGWKGRYNVLKCVRSALEMVAVGATAAGAAVGLVRAFNHSSL